MAGALVGVETGFVEEAAQVAEALLAFGGGGECAFLVDDDVGGEDADLILLRHVVFGGEGDGVGVRMFCQEFLDNRAVFVYRDADDD